ncbi:hypothetical protein [Xanthomonas sp. MUS 060]|uniref:hypothetical protein n=1 Tax=Xanthomonas sp. MUS 060 TaxID=1588031 RepID=UPI000A3DD6C1|nr:hypothetical protein [Xanthomonas sp. MUS 060]
MCVRHWRGVQHRLGGLTLFVLMRTGVLAVALVVFAFVLLCIHGLAVQLRVLLRDLVLLLARCLRLLFLLLQLRDPRLFLHVHAGRFRHWRGVQHRLGGLTLFVLMRTGVLAVALVVFAFVLLCIHGLAVQLRVLLRDLVLLLARCLRLLFLLLQLRDPRLFLHVHAGRFFTWAAVLCCGGGACTCVGDRTKCGAWCCCACCLSTTGCGVDAAGAL